ncbi:MAG: ABC transporter ATP-binding protein [bacterium]|nr:MAG: ABC transporter ATP-binding protein [bacterium]
MIRLEKIIVTYRTDAGIHEALAGVDLAIERGTSCVIIGPTGCGKTSLLYLLAGLLEPASGQVILDGRPLSGVRRQTSLILQQHGLFPWKNALANASLGLGIRGAAREKVMGTTRTLMEKMGIWDVRRSYPAQLSGGQRQRVAIARSLATDPDLLLMDEPFSALDAMTRESLQELFLGLWKERSFTSVLVTHSIEEAAFLGNRIVVLSPRPGRVLGILENPEMGDPRYRLSESFHLMCSGIRRLMEGSR